MSSLASHVCLPQMRPSNLEVRIPNERQLPLALCENFFASSESNETRWGIQDGMTEEGIRGSQKLPQAVSRLPTWKALRNQYLRMMHMDDTPFGQKEFEVLRKSMKMEHEERVAKGWIVVKTLKDQKELIS
ncbi:unnamed protein product [Caenorhabditis nigoni]